MKKIFILWVCLFAVACSGQTKEELLAQGNQLQEQNNYRGAIVFYKNALEKDANYLEARTELANAYLASGSYAKAENEYQKVLHQNPAASELLLKLAKVYIGQGKLEEALLQLDKFHSSNPETVESLTINGRAHGASGDIASAEKLFKKALQLAPEAIQPRLNLAKVYLQRKNYAEARLNLKSILAQDPKFVRAYYLLASLEMRDGHQDEALEVYRSLLTIKPKELQALYMVGLLQMEKGQLDEAGKTVDDLLRRFKDRPEGLRLKGLLLYHQGKFADAVTAFEVSLKTQQHLLAYFFMGLSRYNLDQLELALNDFQKALDLDPAFERARILVAMTLLKQKRVDDAVIEIQKVLRSNPNNAYAHNILGSAYLAKGQLDEGMAELEQATKIDPGLADAYLKRGLFHLATGEGAQGEADLVKAIAAAPEVLNSRLMLVTHYLRQKNFTAAIETLQEGMNGSASDALLQNYLAAAYFSQQKPELALQALRKAKELNPEYLTPYFNLASYAASKADYPQSIGEYQAVLERDAKNTKALLGLISVYSLSGQTAEIEKTYQQLEATGTEEGFARAADHRAKLKQFGEALAIADRGLAVIPNSAALFEIKGRLYLQQKQFDQAESAFTRLSGLAPERGNQFLLGLYFQSGKTAKAQQLVDNLLKSTPTEDYPYLLATALAVKNQQKQQAIEILNKGISLVPKPVRLQMQLGAMLELAGDRQKAEQTYQEIISSTPRFAPAYMSLGFINEQRGDKGQALELYRSALEYDPKNVAVLNNLAYLLTDNFGQAKEALDLALRAYRNQTNDPRIMDTLGYVLLKNDRAGDALKLLSRATELLPNVATVKLHLAMAHLGEGQQAKARELLKQVVAGGNSVEKKQAQDLLKKL